LSHVQQEQRLLRRGVNVVVVLELHDR